MYRENIEKMLRDDIREKKKTGSGAFHMRGKGVRHGFNGALRTPYHFMKTKERNKLNGEVEVFNMYETILTRKEFDLKDKDTQRELLTRWREIYPNTKIMEEMCREETRKFNTQTFADLVNNLGVPKKYNAANKPKKEKESKRKSKAIAIEAKQEEFFMPATEETKIRLIPKGEAIQNYVPTPVPIPEPEILMGMKFQIDGEYTADQLNKILTKLQLITDGEENKFKISINLIELA